MSNDIETLKREFFEAGGGEFVAAMMAKAAEMRAARIANSVPVRREVSAGRNDPCPCGSGKKYKKCCIQKELTS